MDSEARISINEQQHDEIIHQISQYRNLQTGIPHHAVLGSLGDWLDLTFTQTATLTGLISERITQLDHLPLNLTNETPNSKMKILLELKALHLFSTQQRLRAQIVQSLHPPADDIYSPLINRRLYFRPKQHFLLPDPIQRGLKPAKVKPTHKAFLSSLSKHAENFNRQIVSKSISNTKLCSWIQRQHYKLEKEEQLRVTKLKQDRISALKSNDEEAYMKLINKAKDSRIMNILNQTNEFIAKLTSAVESQKETVVLKIRSVNQLSEEEEETQLDDYYNTAHKIKETITKQPRMLVGGELKDFQIKGLEWMVSLFNNKLNGILADEMGLGKTIQTIALITYLMETKGITNPFLIVVPLSTIANWENEFEKWAPSIKKIVYKGTKDQRSELADEIKLGKFHVLITTYQYVSEKAVLSRPNFIMMIIDEGQKLKNPNSKFSRTMTENFKCPYRLILTGTPLQNNLPELWALLNFILPKVFNSVKTFDEWFSVPFSSQLGSDLALKEEEQLLIIKRLHKVLRPFLLRRLKKDVAAELPDKVESIIKIRMSALQKLLYDNSINKRTFLQGKEAMLLQNLMMHLRKICNHPFVCGPVEDHFPDCQTEAITDTIYRVSGKFEWLDRNLPKFYATGHRLLIFFQMTSVMNVMSDYLEWKGYKFLRLDGTTKSEDRTICMDEFNKPGSEYFIFMLSTRAGGLGLNLQSADTVIIFDSDWNPHQDLQAQDRAYRIGQTKEVRVYRLITVNSIEEHILSRAEFKLDIDKKVIQGGKFDQKTTAAERDRILQSLFGIGNDDEEGEESNKEDDEQTESEELNDDELNLVLARSEQEMEVFKKIDEQRIKIMTDNEGNILPRLITYEELPDSLKRDDTDTEVEEELGRGRRSKHKSYYADNMDEDDWLMAIEAGAQPQDLMKEKADSESGQDSSNEENGKLPSKRKRKSISRLGDSIERNKQGSSGVRTRGRGRSFVRTERIVKVIDYSKPDTLAENFRRDLTAAFERIFEKVKTYEEKIEDGNMRQVAELFLTLPSKRKYKDYYELIKTPISLNEIGLRLDSMYYDTPEQFKQDFKLLFENARTYNLEGSDVYHDSDELEKVFDAAFESEFPNGIVSESMQINTQYKVLVENVTEELEEGSARKKLRVDELIS